MIIKEFMGLYFRNKYCKILPTFRLKVERGIADYDFIRFDLAIDRYAFSRKVKSRRNKKRQRLEVYLT